MSAVVHKLEAVFNDIAATRMAGLPICNEAVRVQAVGFCEWHGLHVGVLVTPWTMNLVLLPGDGAELKMLGPDEKMSWVFPSGTYDFMGLNEPALGNCQVCALISPLSGIASHEDAVSIASQVMTALFVTAQQAKPEPARVAEAARLKGESMMDQPLSRRDFLRGGFWGK
jgi:[NiFe] hydrogenase assembly HybE family chaperone